MTEKELSTPKENKFSERKELGRAFFLSKEAQWDIVTALESRFGKQEIVVDINNDSAEETEHKQSSLRYGNCCKPMNDRALIAEYTKA